MTTTAPKFMGLTYETMFTLHIVNSINLTPFTTYFDNLPTDPYIKGTYRQRRLSRFRVTPDLIEELPKGYLYQPKEYNPLLGDIKREFSQLEYNLTQLEEFKTLIWAFWDYSQFQTEIEIGVHQIRTTCSPTSQGNPAPEGIHQDGTKFVAIVSVARNNIIGGATHLYKSPKEEPVFSKTLYPGELLIVNDRRFFHYTTPIKPIEPTRGFRDVFVITCPSLLLD